MRISDQIRWYLPLITPLNHVQPNKGIDGSNQPSMIRRGTHCNGWVRVKKKNAN